MNDGSVGALRLDAAPDASSADGPRKVVVLETADDTCMILPTVTFAGATARLDRPGRDALDGLVECLRHFQLTLAVYADPISPDTNATRTLRAARARLVRDELLRRGVDDRRLLVTDPLPQWRLRPRAAARAGVGFRVIGGTEE